MVTVRHSHSTEYNPGETTAWLSSLGLPEKKIACLLEAEQWLQQHSQLGLSKGHSLDR